MTLTSILVTLVLLLALYVKWRFIKVPKGYTFIAHFDKPTKVLSITGSPDDSRSWYLMSPFEKRLTVKLEVYKVMELDLAQKKQAELKAMNDPNESLSIISTFDEVKKDDKRRIKFEKTENTIAFTVDICSPFLGQ